MSEKDYINDIKAKIHDVTLVTTEKANRSALAYAIKKKWITVNDENMVEFFNKKVPQRLSERISTKLNNALGLDL